MKLKRNIHIGDTILVRGSRYGTIIGFDEKNQEIKVAIWKKPKEILRIKHAVFEKSLDETFAQEIEERGNIDDKFIEEMDRIEARIPSLHIQYEGRMPP